MKTAILSCFFCLLAFLPATAQEKAAPEAEAFFKKAMAEINPRHSTWIKLTAKSMHENKMSELDAKSKASQYGTLNNLNNLDIEALTFLVMMQTTKDAQEDLKSIMADIKKCNEKKNEIRNLQRNFELHKNNISRPGLDSINLVLQKQPEIQMVSKGKVLQPVKPVQTRLIKEKQLISVSPTVTKPEIDKVAEAIKAKEDSFTEMGEELSLRLQMFMDSKNKMMSTLSNLLKKMSETSSNIMGNLK